MILHVKAENWKQSFRKNQLFAILKSPWRNWFARSAVNQKVVSVLGEHNLSFNEKWNVHINCECDKYSIKMEFSI